MFVRRGHAALRLGAGLLLALTCAAAPAVVAAPAAGAPTPPGACEGVAPSASATSTELGGTVEVDGDCFPTRTSGTVEIFIQGENGSRMSQGVSTGGERSVHASFTPTAAGQYQAVIEVGGQSATASFEVFPAEEPSEPPVEEPSDPPEEPTEPPEEEPTDPTDPPEEEPTEPPVEEPTEPTDPPTSDDPTDPAPSDPEPTEEPTSPAPSTPVPSEDPTSPAPTTPAPGEGEEGDDDQQESPAPSAGAEPDEDEDSPAPSAGERPEPPPRTSEPPTASEPGAENEEDPAATPEHTLEQKRAAELAILMTSLFAHGVSDGEAGLSPAEIDAELDGHGGATGEDGGADGSDEGGEELAETGTDVTAPAALAGLALLGGAGLLWHQRRRRD